MTIWHWILIIELGLSGLVVFGRGFAESVKRYTVWDGILGAAECAFLIWIVAVKL